MDHINDDIILDKILAGDNSQYKILINKYKDYAFTLAYNILNHREEAEEAAQDSFVKAFRHLPKFNRKAKFSTWLYKIVTNTAITYCRKQKVKKEDIDRIAGIGEVPVSELELADRKKFIRRALALLNEQDRSVISLFYLKELSLEEIAEVTGIKGNLVKVKLHRARKKLAKYMKLILQEEALIL
ncbi:RNA polymerase sigma factor [Fulvivirga sp. M361]|uniref:RNA polymerase sigma factor n=1 Tax=Fulvivirga sp. M361 TaxID=2594266 RepID=UPI00117A1DB0|nr:RNA polymerase sigma factor [Fulvivirga sp. M361]TRX52034.1 RNA polymerase sigma factor [Fulvivirga sp. M361]